MTTLYVDNIAPNLQSKISAPNLTLPSGSIIQVVSNVPTMTQAAPNQTTSTTFVEVNSLMRTTITPKYASSKILIIAGLGFGVQQSSGNDADGRLRLYDVTNSNPLKETGLRVYDYGGNGIYGMIGSNLTITDTPNTTSPITYTWQFKLVAGVNVRTNDENDSSFIHLLEIAG